MSNHSLDGICGSNSIFWNINGIWYTNDPDFTECFQKTVLIWIPCAFLWIFSPLEWIYITRSVNRNVPFGFLNIAKLILTAVLIILSATDLIIAIVQNGDDKFAVAPFEFYSPAIKILTFMLSAVLLEANRRYGLRTSGVQFLFWTILLICGIPQIRTQIRGQSHSQSNSYVHYQLWSYLTFYVVCAVVWLLNCYADLEPMEMKYQKSVNLCPEERASFLSRLFFTWFDPMAWKGYRQPLEKTDLWDINPKDASKEIRPLFIKYWDQAKSSGNNVNKTTSGFTKKSISSQTNMFNEKKKKRTTILIPIIKAFGATFLFGSILEVVELTLTFVSPQLLREVIKFVQSGKKVNESTQSTDEMDIQYSPMWHGIVYAVLLFAVASIKTLCAAQYNKCMIFVGVRIRTALIGKIYQKSLNLSNSARKSKTVGEIVNLMAVDTERLRELTSYINMTWTSPLQVALAIYFLWDLLGVAVLAGLAVMVILIPINAVLANKLKNLQIRQMKNKDDRIKLMNEILGGIKVLKLYAWEPSFENQVQAIRNREIDVLKRQAYLNAAITLVWSCAPFLVALLTFTCYVLIDEKNVLNAEKAFAAIALFNILQFPFSVFPMLVVHVVQGKVSVERINNFLNSDELDSQNVSHDPSDEIPISIENGTFSWGNVDTDSKDAANETHPPPTLKNINIHVKKNTLVAIVGKVGAGKTSIVSALLGEMEKLSGHVNTVGSIAYVSQQAWIQNATLRDNILFGSPMNSKRYNQVITACALKPDIQMLPGGDATEIGEKGINLSGGQKQRVSLARAVYADAESYYFDDPLSAVDSHVGKHIFENVIGPTGILAGKTRLLVTHSITFLPDVDEILVIKDGEISEMGNLNELLEKQGDFAEFLIEHLQESNGNQNDLDDIKLQLESTLGKDANPELIGKFERAISYERSRSVSQSDTTSINGGYVSNSSTLSRESVVRKRSMQKQVSEISLHTLKDELFVEKLIEQEKSEVGNVKMTVYKHYLKSIGVGLASIAIILSILYQVFLVGTNAWLTKWSTDETAANDTSVRNMYLGVYAALGLGSATFSFAEAITLSLGFILSAKQMHRTLLSNVFRWPMAMFDTTPLGRILSRFSKDMEAIDIDLPGILQFGLSLFFSVLSTLVVISVSTPLFLVVILPISVIYYFVQRFYVATSRQLKRLESVSRSPIYSHFGESIQGAPTIRAYGVQDRFITTSDEKVDNNQICYCPSVIANRWLAVRLESVGNLIILFSALFGVLNRNSLNPGMVGLSISYALQITETLNWLVRMTSEMETNIVAVERIKEYAEIKQEAPWQLQNENVPKDWPPHGQVKFEDVDLRYRDGLELVLHQLTFTVNGSEKVGIVGRTGAGKSSLTLALFRIIELAGGSISIDGVDISKIGLHSLRSRLTIIPQDPVLFSGTFRLNLDPFEEKSDDEIWHALELAHLKSFVKGLTSGLNHEISEGGENLSVGQRQLVCLARALLRKTKVLILDEATASVDLETDNLIQKTIRGEFNDCTVLIIAHRLNTIIDADKIIVLDRGKLSEIDTPENLLADKNSAFYSMAKDAGLV